MSRTNILLAVILCLLFGITVGLGQGMYVTANAGYSFGAGTQYIGGNYDYTKTPVPVEGVHGSYGEGFKFGASVGYMINRNLGAELGFAYWLRNTLETQSKFTTGLGIWKRSGSGFVAVPSFVLSANLEPVNPYARIGLVLGILKVDNEYQSQSAGHLQDIVQEETGNLAFGYAGGLGVLVPAGSAVSFFVEASIHTVTYSPGQSEYTKLMDNGVDQLPLLPHKVYEFKESFTTDEEGVYMAARRPFSSIGFVVGVRINL